MDWEGGASPAISEAILLVLKDYIYPPPERITPHLTHALENTRFSFRQGAR